MSKDYVSGKIQQWKKRPAIFLDRDGVINEDRNFIHRIDDFHLLPGVAEAIHRINQSDYLAIVVTNQSVIARNLCTLEELDRIHVKMDGLLATHRAKLDGLYYCPHHPSLGNHEKNPIYRRHCNCRKPKAGMLDAAQRDFNIDLKTSYMIGDSNRDIECAYSRGLKSITITSERITIKANFYAKNLLEAVAYICKY